MIIRLLNSFTFYYSVTWQEKKKKENCSDIELAYYVTKKAAQLFVMEALKMCCMVLLREVMLGLVKSLTQITTLVNYGCWEANAMICKKLTYLKLLSKSTV
jgi:hypothetical protein